MSGFLFTFEYKVDGIPCQIGVLNYDYCPPVSRDAHQCHSDLEYYGYSEVDYVVLDRRGYPAPWLQRKVSDDTSIIEEIQERMRDD